MLPTVWDKTATLLLVAFSINVTKYNLFWNKKKIGNLFLEPLLQILIKIFNTFSVALFCSSIDFHQMVFGM